MEALELLPIASMTLLGAATAVRCRLFGQRWRQRRQQDGVQWCGALQNLGHASATPSRFVQHVAERRPLGGAASARRARAGQPAHAHPGATAGWPPQRGGCVAARAMGNAFAPTGAPSTPSWSNWTPPTASPATPS